MLAIKPDTFLKVTRQPSVVIARVLNKNAV